jgi:hypothetical protein
LCTEPYLERDEGRTEWVWTGHGAAEVRARSDIGDAEMCTDGCATDDVIARVESRARAEPIVIIPRVDPTMNLGSSSDADHPGLFSARINGDQEDQNDKRPAHNSGNSIVVPPVLLCACVASDSLDADIGVIEAS